MDRHLLGGKELQNVEALGRVSAVAVLLLFEISSKFINKRKKKTYKTAGALVETIVRIASEETELGSAVVVRAAVGIERNNTALPQLGHAAAGANLGVHEDSRDDGAQKSNLPNKYKTRKERFQTQSFYDLKNPDRMCNRIRKAPSQIT